MKRFARSVAGSALVVMMLGMLTACGGDDDNNDTSSPSGVSSSSTSSTSSSRSSSSTSSVSSSAASSASSSAASSSSSSVASSSSSSVAPGVWASAVAGDVLAVKLSTLKPTQGGLGFDQVYYKLGRYEVDVAKKFDDFCADEGMTGVTTWSATSTIKDSTSFVCTVTDTKLRDTSVLGTVVVGPNGDSLYLTDGHHGLSTYYEVPDGGPDLVVHVLVRNNLSAYSGTAFWTQMQNNNYLWLKNGSDQTITTAQLPTGLGFKNGMTNDVFRSLVYFTRDVGYSKPASSPDYLEFYWAEWLRSNASFNLASYDLTKLNTGITDPSTDTGYLGAVWNASTLMSNATDPIIAGKTGTDLGKLSPINGGKAYNKGTFGDLLKTMSDTKPGKIAYTLNYKSAHGL